MQDMEAIKGRHSVRNYEDRPIDAALFNPLFRLLGGLEV